MLRSSPLVQLYLTRLRDFYRQPARIFWVYGFPTLLAIVLGWAFQSRPPAPILVDLVGDPGSSGIKSALEGSTTWPSNGSTAAGKSRIDVPAVMVHEEDQASSRKRLNTGTTPLVIEPLGSDSWVYHYDPTRPEAVAARQMIDDILQRSAGRKDPMATKDVYVTEPGSRYIDFFIPGLIGLNAMGGGLWGSGFLAQINFRVAKLLKRFVATPMLLAATSSCPSWAPG